MKKMRMVTLIILIFVMMINLAGCKKKADETETQKPTETVAETEPETITETIPETVIKETEAIPENQNLLTGICDLSEGAIGKRPVAVMINNVAAALPQYGIAQADIIFEIPVEGDLTRLMALYADYTTLPEICSVRSCRYYFPAFSEGFDAFYVNWGIDDSVSDYLEALNFDQFDGMNNPGNLFLRDQARINAGYSLEHTGYFDGPNFAAYLEQKGTRVDLAEDKKGTAFQFNGPSELVKPEGEDCTSIHINFGAATADLTFDEATRTYLKQLNGQPQIDGVENIQLAFTNIFILETEISVRDDIGHKNVNWEGGAASVGYYISNGGIQKIHWQKDLNNEKSYLRFYDEDGNELKINRGKSYIAVNYAGQATFE